MDTNPPQPDTTSMSPRAASLAACLPWLAGFALAAVLNPWVVGLFRDTPLAPYYSRRTLVFFAVCLLMGVAGLAGRWMLVNGPGGRWLAEKPRRAGLVLGAGAALLLLVGAEGFVGLRTAGFRHEPAMVDPDYLLRFRMKKNWSGLVAGSPAATNSRGMRWREVPDAPPPGAHRVLILGDSLLFGFGTTDSEIIPARLEPLLPAGHEVVNGAVIGYDLQEYFYYGRELAALAPDEVVVGLCLNDLSWTTPARLDGPPGAPETRPLPPTGWNRARWWVGFHSGLLNLHKLWAEGENFRSNQEQEAWVLRCATRLADDPAHRQAQLAVTHSYLAGIRDFFSERGVPVRLLVFPYRFQYEPALAAQHPDHAAIQAGIRDIAEELGLPLLDLREPLGREIDARGGDPATLFFDINHFNAEGSRVCAEIIARELFAPPTP